MRTREADVLLVSGLHPDEAGAPPLARAVRWDLVRRGLRVVLRHVPRSWTLLGLLDDPDTAMTRYSRPAGTRRLEMDLDGLDADLARRYPGALVFEFHNGEDSDPIFGIDPARAPEDYEVGTVGPDFVRPYEIGTWRNVDPAGRPAQYLIELPARYRDVDPGRLAARRARLGRHRAAGFAFRDSGMRYLIREVDLEASRRLGYLDACLAGKVAAWIVARHAEGLGVARASAPIVGDPGQ